MLAILAPCRVPEFAPTCIWWGAADSRSPPWSGAGTSRLPLEAGTPAELSSTMFVAVDVSSCTASPPASLSG